MRREKRKRVQALQMIALGVLICAIGVAETHGIDPALMAKAKSGNPGAEVAVGVCYAEGKGVTPDPQQAAAWYRKAADQGYVKGEIHLADLYRDGQGKIFPRDMQQAAHWYRKAADQGDSGAQGTLGMLYTLGQGVPRSDEDAYFWLDLAASAPGADQSQYAINRQNVGTRITADQLDEIHDREARWKAAHSQTNAN